jgi:hypothetical protein
MADGDSGVSAPSGKVTSTSSYVRRQVADALALSGYAVSSGYPTLSGEPLALSDIALIQDTAAKLGLYEDGSSQASVTPGDWTLFEQAYYRLAFAMSPVTAETLAATEATMPGADGVSSLRDRIFGYSPALRFTRWFALVAIVIAAFIVLAECQVAVYGLEKNADAFFWRRNILQSLLPWAYGGLGSCAYLLRSAHYYIYQRSFDLRRKPEYFNRVLLGAISGGAIILFVNYLVNDGDDTVLHLSSAAFGFVAGYSTDFLFNTIERVVAAIFPKTDSDPKVQPQRVQRPVARKPPAAPPPHDGPNGSQNGDQAADGGAAKGKRPRTAAKTAAGSANQQADDGSGEGPK